MTLNWIWILFTLIVLVIDFLSSDFIYSWLIGGFLPAFLLGFAFGFEVQIIIAIIFGTISIILGLKFLRKYAKKNIKKENLLLGKYLGKEFTANCEILKEGQIKVNGVYWYVKNIGEPILKGETFVVTSMDGNVLIIKKGDE